MIPVSSTAKDASAKMFCNCTAKGTHQKSAQLSGIPNHTAEENVLYAAGNAGPRGCHVLDLV